MDYSKGKVLLLLLIHRVDEHEEIADESVYVRMNMIFITRNGKNDVTTDYSFVVEQIFITQRTPLERKENHTRITKFIGKNEE